MGRDITARPTTDPKMKKDQPMDQMTSALEFEPIAAVHRARTQSIHAIFTDTTEPVHEPTGSPLDYAIGHHFLEGAERAARQRDHDTFTWYRHHIAEPMQHWTTLASLGPVITLPPRPADLLSSPIADSPYYLLGPNTRQASSNAVELVSAAFDIAATHGFGSLLARHAPIICLLTQRDLTSPLNSWTITRLPGTVFLDHADDPTLLARDLIHEAGHNWLNDALTATKVTLTDTNTYYSPWKDSQRPTFGYLHSCWAFPLTMIFAARAADTTTDPIRTILNAYFAQHQERLAATNTDHSTATTAITNRDIRERLLTIHQLAQGQTTAKLTSPK
ncbi:aKG-HExxH-type peptide beta-hydroxylase [Nocardia shimofusensis]|uniref:aKG-HExxH-type peptide beta-hydroxylase n=1 Tax=Nocardia shimofusensis TaxID=228596 RepID=UPI000834B177|nr:HEXXH motif-containing putative peptide modification protein [Nocardia shimofusensis]